ncbi:hypothetical protein F2P81_012379 [Scophthalmus maximus]|uniref:Uncharacterized protein n=1 Tax=Scophthalmus maximus TaxID=52904 RepID=A0A6A4SUA1_SCOMX|nr:hypothetical protein F2P81_012379 [Scophthalmus maximus]
MGTFLKKTVLFRTAFAEHVSDERKRPFYKSCYESKKKASTNLKTHCPLPRCYTCKAKKYTQIHCPCLIRGQNIVSGQGEIECGFVGGAEFNKKISARVVARDDTLDCERHALIVITKITQNLKTEVLKHF